MARRYILRYDLWICLALGFLASIGVEKLATASLTTQYETYKTEHIIEAGQIGGPATDEIFRAQDVSDLLSHDTFTVISPGIKWRNDGGGFYDNFYLQLLELPSGERVAARINGESVQSTGDSIYSSDSILPVGHVVRADLSNHPTFLSQIEYAYPLDRIDFYIDMVGDAAIQSEESYIETPVLMLQLATIAIVFATVHLAGSKIGLFPAFYTRKKSELEKKSEWE